MIIAINNIKWRAFRRICLVKGFTHFSWIKQWYRECSLIILPQDRRVAPPPHLCQILQKVHPSSVLPHPLWMMSILSHFHHNWLSCANHLNNLGTSYKGETTHRKSNKCNTSPCVCCPAPRACSASPPTSTTGKTTICRLTGWPWWRSICSTTTTK